MLAWSEILPRLANNPQFVSPAAEGAAIAMLAVIFFLAFAIFGAAMVLRKRARSAPRPEYELLEELNSDERRQERDKPSKQVKPTSGREQGTKKPGWERDADWWKKQDN